MFFTRILSKSLHPVLQTVDHTEVKKKFTTDFNTGRIYAFINMFEEYIYMYASSLTVNRTVGSSDA